MTKPTDQLADGPSILEHISTHWTLIGNPMQFVMRYAPALRRYVGALVKDPHDTEDVIQSLLLRMVQRPFRPEQVRRGRFRDYLKAVVRNEALSHFRGKARRPSTAADLGWVPAAEAENAADRAWVAEWQNCLLQWAWEALELHERQAPDGQAHTVLRLAVDYPQESSAALAARAAALTGRPLGVDAFRKQLSRARRHFAQKIVQEVRQTLEDGRAEDVLDELRDLGLMAYVRDFLPEPFRSAAGQGAR
jgi:RNA polymerase sigma factor (sigma-70 family)